VDDCPSKAVARVIVELPPFVEYLVLTAPHAIGQALLVWNDLRINRGRLTPVFLLAIVGIYVASAIGYYLVGDDNLPIAAWWSMPWLLAAGAVAQYQMVKGTKASLIAGSIVLPVSLALSFLAALILLSIEPMNWK
jgi:hypothetical protein